MALARQVAEVKGRQVGLTIRSAERNRRTCRPAKWCRPKTIQPLREAGGGVASRVKIYEIAHQFLADKENRVLDFGRYLLRLNDKLAND